MKIVKCGNNTLIPISEIYQAYEFVDKVRVHYKHNKDYIYQFDLEIGTEIIRQWELQNSSVIKKLKVKLNDYLNSIRATPV